MAEKEENRRVKYTKRVIKEALIELIGRSAKSRSKSCASRPTSTGRPFTPTTATRWT